MSDVDSAIERAEEESWEVKRHSVEDLTRAFADRAILAAEVKRLQEELDRAHEELRQGWPKMARDANRSAIEQWNRADAAEAEVKRLQEALDRCRKGINTWDDK